ncbi:hypothetical protein NPIL_174571, partial [Nephila pilipes]
YVFFIASDEENDGNLNEMRLQKKRSIQTPIQIEIPIGGMLQNHRLPRQIELCAIPSTLRTAALKCKIFPSSV